MVFARELLGMAAFRVAIHLAGDDEHSGGVIPVHLILREGQRTGKRAFSCIVYERVELDLVHVAQRPCALGEFQQLAARPRYPIARACRFITAGVVHFVYRGVVAKRIRSLRRQRQAVVPEISVISDAIVGELDRKSRVARDPTAACRVIKPIAPDRESRTRIGSIALEALIAAQEVTLIVGKAEDPFLRQAVEHFNRKQPAAAAGSAVGDQLQRGGVFKAGALVAFLLIEIDAIRSSLQVSIHHALAHFRALAAEIEPKLTIGI